MKTVKSRQLVLESLEDRSLPANLNALGVPALGDMAPLGERGGGPSLQSGFLVYDNPEADYLDSTTLMLSDAPTFSNITELADENLYVGFYSPASVRVAPGGGWATWGSPPFTEPTPTQVYFVTGDQWLVFSSPLTTFGVEMEPNQFPFFFMGAVFFSGEDLVGEIYREVEGASGARLFAATSSVPFDSVVLLADPAAGGFAYGRVRYTLATENPGPGGDFGGDPLIVTTLVGAVLTAPPVMPLVSSSTHEAVGQGFTALFAPPAEAVSQSVVPAQAAAADAVLFELVLSDL